MVWTFELERIQTIVFHSDLVPMWGSMRSAYAKGRRS